MMHPDTRKLRRFWKPHGRHNSKQAQLLRDAMKACGSREPSLTFFLYHSKFAAHRKKVVAHLKLR